MGPREPTRVPARVRGYRPFSRAAASLEAAVSPPRLLPDGEGVAAAWPWLDPAAARGPGRGHRRGRGVAGRSLSGQGGELLGRERGWERCSRVHPSDLPGPPQGRGRGGGAGPGRPSARSLPITLRPETERRPRCSPSATADGPARPPGRCREPSSSPWRARASWMPRAHTRSCARCATRSTSARACWTASTTSAPAACAAAPPTAAWPARCASECPGPPSLPRGGNPGAEGQAPTPSPASRGEGTGSRPFCSQTH